MTTIHHETDDEERTRLTAERERIARLYGHTAPAPPPHAKEAA
jgi:hypothetical protein